MAITPGAIAFPLEGEQFVTVFREACAEALTEAPRLQRGDHCRFRPARVVCPAHTGPLLDLTQFNVPTPPRVSAKPYSREDYGKLLSEGLALFDAVKEIGKALHDQAKEALHAGTTIPGYTLTEGRAVRQWANEATAPPDLLKLGLARDDVLVESLRSPKQVEMRAKARAA